MASRYTAYDRERLVDEPPKSSYAAGQSEPYRTPFARDRARILHSSALRRLAAKTQVVVPMEDDFPRTRLTHSLEVAQIAREMGAALGVDADIADAAGLAHDLGHPPFGHNGEDALNSVSSLCGGFEANAQTLRVLTRLESKVLDKGVSAGLNLTRATLDATCKYPWQRRGETGKFGVYADDLPVFGWIRQQAPTQQRCLEAQVMDWSDDVAYSVHDFEDGATAGLIDLSRAIQGDEVAAICHTAQQYYIDAPTDRLAEAFKALVRLPVLAAVAGLGNQAGQSSAGRVTLKRAASELLGRFSAAAVTATRAASGDDLTGRYAADLVVPEQVQMECSLLKACAFRYVMLREGASALQQRQRDVLCELVVALKDRPDQLDQPYADSYREASDDAGRLRSVVDQVAGLTDPSALAWHMRLCGPTPLH